MESSRSVRDRIRDEAERLLWAAPAPMHNAELAREILPPLHLDDEYDAKDVNTCLHDDPHSRFLRVGKGLWTVKKGPRILSNT